MKYLKALELKGLELSSFPKTIQKKVDDLDSLIVELEEIKSLPIAELDEVDKEALKELEVAINELDNYLERKVNLFDPKKYEKKLEQLSVLAEQKKKKSKEKAQIKQEEPKEIKVIQSINLDELRQESEIEESKTLENPVVEARYHDKIPPLEVSSNPTYSSKMVTLSESYGGFSTKVEENEDNYDEELEEDEDYHSATYNQDVLDDLMEENYKEVPSQSKELEEDEFSKVSNTKPKKMSWGFIALGVGFALMTFGAVNIMKNRRG
jgi:hypothetical protein